MAKTEDKEKEGKNLLGPPTFKEIEKGRFRCVETGHELPAHARDTYAESKHCRLGLIDAALARKKPPLNMFEQDPFSRSKLTCKLTGLSVNKSEEHIWKHINGKRFLNMLEKKEAEKQTPNGMIVEQSEQKPEKISKTKADKLKKKKKQEQDVSKIISEVRNPSDKESDSEDDDFWMPPVGDRWDFDDGGDRWGSGSEEEPEIEDASAADGAGEESNNDAKDISKRTKRMSIEIGPSSFASRKKKKKKTESTVSTQAQD
ncbi:hypothetical protein RJ639_010397 [Escallonia herrerae]|uniref:Surfeit locus protein 2 n=1 Tax=Escallonia herrerae TaxID=1293975 RepID=A0AA88VPU5_9ASTE|nr:hypothetical protein RJ639_010397 [Escallonia herrerae]